MKENRYLEGYLLEWIQVFLRFLGAALINQITRRKRVRLCKRTNNSHKIWNMNLMLLNL